MKLLRSALLKASQNSWLRENAPRYRFARRTVERFMPGESAEDALAAAVHLQQAGLHTILSHLGEHVEDRAEAEGVTKHYLEVLGRIRELNLGSELSIKLTQLGFDLDPDFPSQLPHGFGPADPFEFHEEFRGVSALAAAEAVEKLLRRTDRKGGSLFLVEWA